MARPELIQKVIPRVDGTRGVEYQYGTPGDPDFFRDTLWEDWADKTVAQRTVEMNRRYDNWVQQVNTTPDPPTAQELTQQLADAEQAARDAQRRILDIQDLIAAANVENPPTAEE